MLTIIICNIHDSKMNFIDRNIVIYCANIIGYKRLSEVLSILVLEIPGLRAVGPKLFTIIYHNLSLYASFNCY